MRRQSSRRKTRLVTAAICLFGGVAAITALVDPIRTWHLALAILMFIVAVALSVLLLLMGD